ncbi:MAG TPA: hypothetical protein VFH51_18105 [Myxococcota bacterium]|nr:hypothetical protein [Myxococcota bacterium]
MVRAQVGSATAGRRFDAVLFDGAGVDSLDVDRIRQTVASQGVACIRGVFARHTMRALLGRLVDDFDPANDRRHDPRDTEAVRRNFQKLQVGANSGINSRRTLGRFMRILYNPIFAPDIYGLRDHFVTLARLRNRLYGLPDTHAVAGTDGAYWTCSRLHQYPAGGGFIVPHRDVYSRLASTETGLSYFQVMLLLTEKGRDFHEGGAYVEDDAGLRFTYEDHCLSGDVVVYDGRTVHGVADIDPLAELDLSRLSGRVAALASLFRLLRPGADDYAAMADRATRAFGV